jgi:DNA polymerase III alpha subunit
MKIQCDIDIDFANREDILSKIPHVVAGRKDRGEYKRHNTGVYLQKIPVNPLTGLATIDYETAEQRGYFKIDFLNVNAYQGVKNEAHIKQLLEIEPLWDLMYEKDVCDQLFHVNGYHNLLAQLKPTSILELATVLALIRPGKKHLVPICVEKGFQAIQDEVWVKTEEGYSFKKSHAVGYAHVIVMQLNLICERVSYGFS